MAHHVTITPDAFQRLLDAADPPLKLIIDELWEHGVCPRSADEVTSDFPRPHVYWTLRLAYLSDAIAEGRREGKSDWQIALEVSETLGMSHWRAKELVREAVQSSSILDDAA